MMHPSDRRQYERRPITIQVRYRALDTFFYDYALNLSLGGIYIKTRRPLARGSDVELEFEVPGAPRLFRTLGKVVRVVLPGEDEMEPSGMAIEFNPLSDEDKVLIDLLWQASAKSSETSGQAQ